MVLNRAKTHQVELPPLPRIPRSASYRMSGPCHSQNTLQVCLLRFVNLHNSMLLTLMDFNRMQIAASWGKFCMTNQSWQASLLDVIDYTIFQNIISTYGIYIMQKLNRVTMQQILHGILFHFVHNKAWRKMYVSCLQLQHLMTKPRK